MVNRFLEFENALLGIKYGRELKEKEGALLRVTSVDGKIYAVCANLNPGRASGIGYNKELADKYKIQVPEQIDLEALTEIGIQLKEKNTGIYLISFGNSGAVEASCLCVLV